MRGLLNCHIPQPADVSSLLPLPVWRRARGWTRLGVAQLCMGHARAAASAYRKAIELEGAGGSREMQLGLQLAGQALAGQGDRRAALHETEG